MRFVNVSGAVSLHGEQPLAGRDNYFHGSDASGWITDIPTYNQVLYKDLYPGVDLLFHDNSDGSQLEHDFLVAVGSDPRQIRFRLSGADRIRIGADGKLLVTIAGREMIFHPPAAWQTTASERKPIQAAFVLEDPSTVAFRVGKYDHGLPLTIDPVLVFATYLDGTGSDSISAIATDSSGNIYVTGSTSSANFPVVKGEQSVFAGGADAFISKLDPTGHTLLYSTYLGGSNTDNGQSIAVDANGNVAVSGISLSDNFPTAGKLSGTVSTATTTYNFISSLNASGSALRYSGYIGETAGTYDDYNPHLNRVAFDDQGNVYVSGKTDDPNYPYTKGAYGGLPAPYPADETLFVAKIGSDGTVLYGATIPETPPQSIGSSVFNIDVGGLAVDGTGAVVVAGTAGDDLPVTTGVLSSTFPNNPASGTAGYVLKLNPAGSALVFSTYIPGTDAIEGTALDSSNNVYVSGLTQETNLPTSSNAFQPTFGQPNACD
jgi:hypothetical protein